MKAFRTPLILLTVLLILGGIAYWDEQKTAEEEEQKKLENRLFTFKPETVQGIGYFHKDPENPDAEPTKVTLKKEGDTWFVTEPVSAKANQNTVENLIKSVAEYKYERKLDDGRDRLEEYGLKESLTKVTLDLGGEQKQLLLGHKAPVGYSVYAKTGDSADVYLGNQYILMATNKKLDDFRDKSLASIDVQKLKEFIYGAPGQEPIKIAKGEDDKWNVVSPATYKADEEGFLDFIAMLNRESVAGFVDNPSQELLSAFSDDNKETKLIARISWSGEGEETPTLTVMENNEQLYAAYDPSKLIYRIGEDAKPKFQKTLMDFRNRNVFAFDSKQAEKVVIDGKTYLKNEADFSWYAEGDEAKKPLEHVRMLLVDLEFAKATEFLDREGKEAKALKEPEHTIAITLAEADDKSKTIEARFWPVARDEAKDQLFVKHSAGEYLYRVDAKILEQLTPASEKAADETAEDGTEDAPGSEAEHDHNHGH